MEVGKTLLIGNFLYHDGSDDSEDSKKEHNTLKQGNTTNILCPFTIRKSTNFPNSLAFIKNSNMNSKGSWGLYKNSIESSGESNNSKEKIPTMDPQPKPARKYQPTVTEVFVKGQDGISYLEIATSRKVRAGEELYVYYRGDFTNTHYLLNYGFVFYDEFDVTINVFMDYIENDPYLRLKKQILPSIPNTNPQEEHINILIIDTTKKHLYDSVYLAGRVMEVNNAEQLNMILEHIKAKKNIGDFKFDKDNEKKAMKRVLVAVNKQLGSYNHTLEEDLTRINKYSLYSTPRNLIHISICEKKALLGIINYAKSFI